MGRVGLQGGTPLWFWLWLMFFIFCGVGPPAAGEIFQRPILSVYFGRDRLLLFVKIARKANKKGDERVLFAK